MHPVPVLVPSASRCGEHTVIFAPSKQHTGNSTLSPKPYKLHTQVGIEVTQQIRNFADKTHAAVPIIAVTGHAGTPEQRLACFSGGMQAVFDKPLSADCLQSLLCVFIA